MVGMLIRQLVSSAFIPGGRWKSSGRFSIKGTAFPFARFTFVLNVNSLMLSIMVPLSQTLTELVLLSVLWGCLTCRFMHF